MDNVVEYGFFCSSVAKAEESESVCYLYVLYWFPSLHQTLFVLYLGLFFCMARATIKTIHDKIFLKMQILQIRGDPPRPADRDRLYFRSHSLGGKLPIE